MLWSHLWHMEIPGLGIKSASPQQYEPLKLDSFFRAAPVAYGGSQARGQIRALAPGLQYSHSNTRSKPHLQPTPQLMATLEP